MITLTTYLSPFKVRKYAGANHARSQGFSILLFMIGVQAILSTSTFGNTSIVIRRTPQEITVGADTERSFYGVMKGRHIEDTAARPQSVCKIERVNGVLFAMSGFMGFVDKDFSPQAVAIEAIKAGGTIRSIGQAFRRLAENHLTQQIEEIRQTDPVRFTKQFGSKDALSVVFFGVENEVPSFSLQIFRVISPASEPARIQVREQSCPGTIPAYVTLTAFMGQSEAIEQFALDDQFWAVGSAEGIRKLIGIQAKATPETDGGPIDIVRLTKKGVEWPYRKPECTDASSKAT